MRRKLMCAALALAFALLAACGIRAEDFGI